VSGLCRVDAFEVIVAQLEGGSFAVDICDLPATRRITLRRTGDGLAVDVRVDVCDDHGRAITGDDGGFLRARGLISTST